MAFYCYGKKGVCESYPICKGTCEHFDGTGGEHITSNADRIRAMSDVDLAKTITDIAFDLYNCNEGQQEFMTTIKCCDMCDNSCGSCVLQWLKQPADQ